MFALVCPCTIPDQAIFGLIVSPFEHLPTLDPPSFGGWNMSKNLSKMAPKWVVLGPFFLIFRVLGRSWGLLGVLGGSRWVWGGSFGGLGAVLGPSWARFGGSRGGGWGLIFGSLGGPFRVSFSGSCRKASWDRFKLNFEAQIGSKTAPGRPPQPAPKRNGENADF